jgi:predicted esterase YcpF (UPF0227 family)
VNKTQLLEYLERLLKEEKATLPYCGSDNRDYYEGRISMLIDIAAVVKEKVAE